MGDFVKGSALSYLPEEIERGVRLHRFIDTYTDSHPALSELKSQFPSCIRRFSGIVLDVFFDHLLCQHWYQFTDESVEEVLQPFYRDLMDNPTLASVLEESKQQKRKSSRLEQVSMGLVKHRWLSDYYHRDSCIRAFYQIEKRFKSNVHFAVQAERFIEINDKRFEHTFLRFYPQLMQAVQEWNYPSLD